MPSRAHDHPEEWLLRALRGLTAGGMPTVITAENRKKIPALKQKPRGFLEPPGLGRHVNPATELCVALDGRAVMTLEDRCYAFSPPMLAILPAGVFHSEAVDGQSRGYALLWMGLSKSSVYLVVSRYTPRRGWDNPWRHAFFDSSVIGLDKALREPFTSQNLKKINAELIAVLAAVHRDMVVNETARTEADRRMAMLQHLRDYLDTHFDRPISLRQIATSTKLAPNYLNSLFRRWKGRGIHAYLIERRMQKALLLGRDPGLAVKEIAAAVGYADALYFSKAFHDYHGFRPSDLKRRAARS